MSRKKSNEIDIEKALLPKNGMLVIKDKLASAQILDAELDIIDCTFNNDYCVQINTSNLSYITLSIDNLYKLADLIDQAQEHYDEEL